MECKCPKTTQYSHSGIKWEVQLEPHTCGPIAVINCLLHIGNTVGPATRRSLKNVLNVQYKHGDGFEGTKPDDFHKGIVKYISQKRIKRFIGHNAHGVFDNKKNSNLIILYAWYDINTEKYFYHYVFGWRDKNNLIITLNDGMQTQRINTVAQAKKDYLLNHIHPTGVVFPQVWVIV